MDVRAIVLELTEQVHQAGDAPITVDSLAVLAVINDWHRLHQEQNDARRAARKAAETAAAEPPKRARKARK